MGALSSTRAEYREAYRIMRTLLRTPGKPIPKPIQDRILELATRPGAVTAWTAGSAAAIKQAACWDGAVQPAMVCLMTGTPEGVRSRIFAYRILGHRARRRPIPDAGCHYHPTHIGRAA